MLIGLNGLLGAGKDQVYKRIAAGVVPDYLQAEPVVRISFADKLKISAAAALGVYGPYSEDPIAWMNGVKDNGRIVVHNGDGVVHSVTGRQYLQWYGTESHRDVFGTDFWVDMALPPDFDHRGKIVCVTDVRFPNEIARVKMLGGHIWRIIGDTTASADTHASEVPLADEFVDVDIANNIRDDNFKYLDGQIVQALEHTIEVLTA